MFHVCSAILDFHRQNHYTSSQIDGWLKNEVLDVFLSKLFLEFNKAEKDLQLEGFFLKWIIITSNVNINWINRFSQ